MNVIGQFIYQSVENAASSPSAARRRLAALSGGLLVSSGSFIALAEIAHSEGATVRSAVGAGLCAIGSFVSFEGYSYGRSISLEPPTMELLPVAAEAES